MICDVTNRCSDGRLCLPSITYYIDVYVYLLYSPFSAVGGRRVTPGRTASTVTF